MASDKKGAQEQAAKIVFLDESGFSLKSSIRKTWAPRGETPVVRSHFSWKRLHVIGSLICDPDGGSADILLRTQDLSVKEEAIIAYLEALHQHAPGRIVLIWDGLRAHRGAKVAEYLSNNKDWLTVSWLPPYAPDLNPVEAFWSAAKGEPTANQTPDTLAEIEYSLRAYRDRVADEQDRLYGFLSASGLFPAKVERSLM